MHSALAYFLVAGAGVLIAHFISRAPELRALRLSQLLFVPAAMVVCVYFLPAQNSGGLADIGRFSCFLGSLGFLAILLTPNIAHHCGAAFSNFFDPQDWTSADEEIALRPIRRLIEKDLYIQAFDELEALLKKHKPTYEAHLLRAKLLHHFGRREETLATLLSLIELSRATPQQLVVMELLASLEELHSPPSTLPASGTRRIQIRHGLILFRGSPSPSHKEIPPDNYEVEEILHRHRRWLKLAGEDWGNADICWEAIQSIDRPAPVRSGILRQISRISQSLVVRRKPRLQLQAEAQKLFREANQFICRNDWHNALPLLQKASASDPDRYEIAYRWVQAVQHTANQAAIAQAVAQVLKQSQWTENEQEMLRQLKQPFASETSS